MDLTHLHPGLLALAIVLARIADVSLGTLRTIVLFRGYRFLAAGLGFFEVLIWLTASMQVFRNLGEWYLAVAYAGGFALGNVVGSWLEGRLAIGYQLARIVSETRTVTVSRVLREAGYGVTELAGFGPSRNPVEVLLVVERRRRFPELLRMVKAADPEAYWTISDIRREPDRNGPRIRRFLSPLDWGSALKKR